MLSAAGSRADGGLGCPKGALDWIPVSGYTFLRGKTTTAVVRSVADLPDSSVQELADACSKRAECGGFTTSGQLKGIVGNNVTALAASAETCAGLYVRSMLTGAKCRVPLPALSCTATSVAAAWAPGRY